MFDHMPWEGGELYDHKIISPNKCSKIDGKRDEKSQRATKKQREKDTEGEKRARRDG